MTVFAVLFTHRLGPQVVVTVFPRLGRYIEDHLGHAQPVDRQLVNLLLQITPLVQVVGSWLAADHPQLLPQGNGGRAEFEIVVALDQLPILGTSIGFGRLVMKDDDVADFLCQLFVEVLLLGLLLKMTESLVEEDRLLAQLPGQLSLQLVPRVQVANVLPHQVIEDIEVGRVQIVRALQAIEEVILTRACLEVIFAG